jgi:H+/gluconate symporter-like permease
MQDDQPTSPVSPLALAGAITGIFVLIFSIIYLFFRSPSSSSKADEINNENEIKTENDKKKQPIKSTTSKAVKQDPKAGAKFIHPWLCASLRAHSSTVTGLDFSHNDKYLASAAEGNFVINILLNLYSYL